MGCGDAADVDRAFEHVGQAVRYLLVGKDDCVRKAAKGFDVMTDLRRMCPKLTPQQIYRLTEQHHDDWIAGLPGSTSNYTIILLELLKRHVCVSVSWLSVFRVHKSGVSCKRCVELSLNHKRLFDASMVDRA